MSRRRRPQALDKTVADRVRELHREHPQLGHEGILRLLEDDGIAVDEHELRLFMETNELNAEPTATWQNSTDPLRAVRGDTGKT